MECSYHSVCTFDHRGFESIPRGLLWLKFTAELLMFFSLGSVYAYLLLLADEA